MATTSLVLLVLGCGAGPEPAAIRGHDIHELAREGVDTGQPPPTPPVPDCSLLALCPQAGVDPSRCLDDAALFEVTSIDGEVVDVRWSELGRATPPSAGTWFTVLGTCERLVVRSFEVAEVSP